MRIDLKVPYKEKDQARRAGARWDRTRSTWFVEDMENLEPVMKWIPAHLKKAHQPKVTLGQVPANWQPPEWCK